MQKRFSRFSRRSLVGVIVALAFAAAAGVGLAQITSEPSSTESALGSASISSRTSTGRENDFADESNDDQLEFEQEDSNNQSTSTNPGGVATTSTAAQQTSTIGGEGAGQEKVDVCHVTGSGKSHTINIARPAVAAHVAHGDTEGACAETTTTSAPTKQSSTTTTTAGTKKPKHGHTSSHGNSMRSSTHVSHSSSTHTSHGNSGHSSHGNGGGHGNGHSK